MKLLLFCNALCVTAILYPNGKGPTNGKDDVVSLDASVGNTMEKVPLNEPIEILGVEKSVLWLSGNGAVSFEALPDGGTPSDIVKNIVFAPMWGDYVANIGKIQYRAESDTSTLGDVEEHAKAHPDTPNSWSIKSALVVTWKNIVNPTNSEEKNQYQLAIAQGTSGQNVLIFNYHRLDWSPDADVGIFGGIDETESCHTYMNSTGLDVSIAADTSNVGIPGVWVYPLGADGTSFQCEQKFTTECEEPQTMTTVEAKGHMDTNGAEDPEEWSMYNEYKCNPQFEISDGIDSLIAHCRYDPDYYDSRWDNDSPNCIDPDARKTFDVNVVVDRITGIPAAMIINEGPGRSDGGEILHNSVSEFISVVGVDESQVGEIKITPFVQDEFTDGEVEQVRNEEKVKIEFEIALPLILKNTVTEDDLEEQILNIFSEQNKFGDVEFDNTKVIVKETTRSCLVDCLGCRDPKNCGSKPPPVPFDACCGGCPAENDARGKPYSTLYMACCVKGWEGEIFDPDTHVCCAGEVITKVDFFSDMINQASCYV
jgi:hypothetical protein